MVRYLINNPSSSLCNQYLAPMLIYTMYILTYDLHNWTEISIERNYASQQHFVVYILQTTISNVFTKNKNLHPCIPIQM